MPEPLIRMDPSKAPDQQELPPHNRWHPDIPAQVSLRPGEKARVECIDWTGGQIGYNDSANDVRDMELEQVHYLSGPINVDGAEPGDLLVVDLLDIGPIPGHEWGFTGNFALHNGGSFLVDVFPDAHKAIWDFDGIYATSRHIPGVRFAGIVHPGLIGCAPDADTLAKWNRREQELIDTDPDRVPPLANPPTGQGALLGSVDGSEFDRIVSEGARTVPPREHGGNVDIKNLSRGSRLYLPVYVDGAKLSLGDLHFSQGDGEITFCGGIEMAGYVDLGIDLIKGGVATYGITNPIFEPGPMDPRYSEFITFQGISVDDEGRQHYMDANISYRRACLNAIEYLTKFGYSAAQAYLLLSTAPVEGRVSGIVDIPNTCTTLYVPTEIFEQEVRPSADGPQVVDRGEAATTS